MYGRTHRDDFVCIAGYEDHSLDMLFVYEPEGTLAGAVLAIPCSSQVTEHLEEFSADYWRDVRLESGGASASACASSACAVAATIAAHAVYSEQELEMLQRRGLTQRQESPSAWPTPWLARSPARGRRKTGNGR